MKQSFYLQKKFSRKKIGDIGENIAKKFLVKRGFVFLGSNYYTRFGEIDIIVSHENTLYFYEVKTVTHETFSKSKYDPFYNVSREKVRKTQLAILDYLEKHGNVTRETEKSVSHETNWEFGVISVVLHMKHGKASISVMENVVI